MAYSTALAVSAAAHAWLPFETSGTSPSRLLHPGVLGLGIGAAMIELGYVLTYRAGWPVSVASQLVNGMVAVLLVGVGLVGFGHLLSGLRVIGLLLCLAGVWPL